MKKASVRDSCAHWHVCLPWCRQYTDFNREKHTKRPRERGRENERDMLNKKNLIEAVNNHTLIHYGVSRFSMKRLNFDIFVLKIRVSLCGNMVGIDVAMQSDMYSSDRNRKWCTAATTTCDPSKFRWGIKTKTSEPWSEQIKVTKIFEKGWKCTDIQKMKLFHFAVSFESPFASLVILLLIFLLYSGRRWIHLQFSQTPFAIIFCNVSIRVW